MNLIKIKYCTQCGWLLRSSWIAQELLSTFSEEIDELVLVPSTGGVFEVTVNDELVWSREKERGFPDIKVLKRLVRNIIAPEMNLGHVDK